MQRIWTSLAVLGLLLGAGCTSNNGGLGGFAQDLGTATAPSSAPDIQGTLTKLDSGSNGGTLRIEANPQDSSGSAKAVVQLNAQTTLMRQDGHRISYADFRTGQSVRAWFSGPVVESYPVQAIAGTVMLVQ